MIKRVLVDDLSKNETRPLAEIFSSIKVASWRQFRSVEIDFHPRLTIITGPNGTGKSTILGLLTRHFGYSRYLLATPERKPGSAIYSFTTSVWSMVQGIVTPKPDPSAGSTWVGTVRYSSGSSAEIYVPIKTSVQYQAEIRNQKDVPGTHIDSHRPPSLYRDVPNYPATAMSVRSVEQGLASEMRHYYQSGTINQGALYHIKSSLIAMSIFGYGNPTMDPNPELLRLYRGFEDVLRLILPQSLGFKSLVIRSPEILLSTDTGDFVIDGASGGVIKLVEIAWQIYFFSQQHDHFVVTMDEPENHLHPSLQRTMMQQLLTAFPKGQFIVVTHSPFIVSSVRDSTVYVLRYELTEGIIADLPREKQEKGLSGRRIVSERLDPINKAGTAADILRDVLGVPTTIPEWVEERADVIIKSFKGRPVTATLLDELHSLLLKEGMISRYPSAVEELTRE